PALVAHISAAMTLLPGDVILTGTPAGVGPIRPGDEVAVTVDGIGTLVNPVRAATVSGGGSGPAGLLVAGRGAPRAGGGRWGARVCRELGEDLGAAVGDQAGPVGLGYHGHPLRGERAGAAVVAGAGQAGGLVEPDERRIEVLGRAVEGQRPVLCVGGQRR